MAENKALNVQFFKDGDDLVVVFKGCKKSSVDIIKAIASVAAADIDEEDIEETEGLLPPPEEEPQMPEMSEDNLLPDFLEGKVLKCPICGQEVLLTDKAAACTACKFRIAKKIKGLVLPDEQLTQLIEKGETDFLDGFVSPKGRYTAKLRLRENDLEFVFPK